MKSYPRSSPRISWELVVTEMPTSITTETKQTLVVSLAGRR